MKDFEAVIGLEVHAQLSTNSKIFASSSTEFNKPANSLTDPVTLGLPGSLPVLNKRAVDLAIKLGLATNCQIKRESIFARKHYFYPDLPKGYQISQYEQPICEGGNLEIRIDNTLKTIGITRIHLEEDAGKSSHLTDQPFSVVDLNRAGVPLVEIVSEPDLRSGKEANAYMRHLHQILRYLDICDGNMEEGSLRCDANVSVRERGAKELGTKVEIKNLNSFRFIERAVEYEISRQIALIEHGGKITQETRLWDEHKGATKVMRSKEQAEDYRYFPDPDLLPVIISEGWIAKTKAALPELPNQTFRRFKTAYGLEDDLAERLTEGRLTANYFDQAVSNHNNPPGLANWIITELFGRLNKESLGMENCPVSPEQLASLVRLIDEEVISGKIAKSVFDEMFSTGLNPDSIIDARGLKQISNPKQIEEVIDRILNTYPEQAEEFRQGKGKMLGFFVGEIMKETQGKANPRVVNEILQRKLS